MSPRTPAKKDATGQIEFKSYSSSKPRSFHDEVKTVDEQVRETLDKAIAEWDGTANHLYVFSSPEAKGLYKVGHGMKITRPTTQWEQCYPRHELHCYIECPNAKKFEDVVHAEFYWSRKTHYCVKCKNGKGTDHVEWFEADIHDLLDSVTAWSMYARWYYRHGVNLDHYQPRKPVTGFSKYKDRWRNWALEQTMLWAEALQGPMPPVPRGNVRVRKYGPETELKADCETAITDEYFSESVPGLSDSPGATPGSEGIYDPPTPSSPTPMGRGTAQDKYTGKQSASWTPEKEEDECWGNASAKPIARALFTRSDQRPSGPGRKLLDTEDPAFHALSTKGPGEIDEPDYIEGTFTKTTGIQGTLVARTFREVRQAQVTKAGSGKELGYIHLLAIDSTKGFYRVCGRSDNKDLVPAEECFDSATSFQDIPYYKAAKSLLLAQFKVSPPSRKCERCRKGHREWIRGSENEIITFIETWREFVQAGCLEVDGCNPSAVFYKWREEREYADKVGDIQKDMTTVEDGPTGISPSKAPVAVDAESCGAPEGKTNGIFGGQGGVVGKAMVSQEQQAPGLISIGMAAVRGIWNGLL